MPETNDTPEAWALAINRLSMFNAPCPGFRGDEWPDVHAACKAFLADHAAQAAALGWTGLDLFGVHEKTGATRVDFCGALMVSSGRPVERVTADAVHFPQTRYFKSSARGQVLVWQWGKAA